MQSTSAPAVLVVEDDDATRALVVLALSERGCRVEEAGDVDRAVFLARKMKFDVLFIDFKLPGKNGTELIRKLEGVYSLGQMVLVSALPELQEGRALADLGGVALLPKPLTAEALAACVERVTGVRLRPGRVEY
jgi:DNA-binding response OmpR family regulator